MPLLGPSSSRHRSRTLLLLLLSVLLIASRPTDAQVTSTFLRKWIYTDLQANACVRLLNATHAIGCSSQSRTGILYLITSEDGIRSFDSAAPLQKSISYIPVIPYSMLSSDIIKILAASPRVSGILVKANTPDTVDAIKSSQALLSHETKCPSCEYGLYANQSTSQQHQWNPTGSGLIYDSFTLPIFVVTNETEGVAVNLTQLAEANARGGYTTYPQNAIELDSFMSAADVGAETCLRRGFCLPIGGFSIYSTPSISFSSKEINKPIIVLTASLDSVSLFHDRSQGAGSSIAGVIALLAVVDALTKGPISPSAFRRQLVYSFFNTEQWGHSGSDLFVEDMTNFHCEVPSNGPTSYCPYFNTGCSNPCRLNTNFTSVDINAVTALIDMNQLGGVGSLTDPVLGTFIHTHDNSTENVALATLLADVGRVVGQQQFASRFVAAASAGNTNNLGLPPSPAMAFLKRRNFPVAVISDFTSTFNNKFYATDYDDIVAVTANLRNVINHTCYSATVTAKAVYYLANADATGNSLPTRPINISSLPDLVQANCTLIEELFDCFLRNVSCAFMRSYVRFGESGAGRPSTYTNVLQSGAQPKFFSQFIYEYLFNATAHTLGVSCVDTSCPDGFVCKHDQCYNSSTLYHLAYGPGLHYNVNKLHWTIADQTKPHWVESNWRAISIRIFQIESLTSQIVQLIIGIIFTSVTVCMVWFINKWLQKVKRD